MKTKLIKVCEKCDATEEETIMWLCPKCKITLCEDCALEIGDAGVATIACPNCSKIVEMESI